MTGTTLVVDGGLTPLLRRFTGALPYLQLIARANAIADPFDARVVEAYWLGNELLDGVEVRQLYDSLLERFGKPDEAIAEYEEVVRSYPKAELAANNLAMLLVTYRKDQASLDRAKELSKHFAESGNAGLLDTYGWVLYKRGESSASVPVLSRVVAKLPNQGFARYHLGMALALAGKNAEARENLSQAVNSGQRFAGLDEAKATLDKIAKLPDATAAPKT